MNASHSIGAAGVAPHDHDHVAELVKAFIQMMQAGNIARLELEHGDLRVSLRAHVADGANSIGAPRAAQPRPDEQLAGVAVASGHHVVTAPMIGAYYEAAAPGEAPFVRVGERVEEGQTVAIIEAMKIMNEIAADRAGVVVSVLATNGQMVEYGSPLLELDPEG